MAEVSNPADYEHPNWPIRRDYYRAICEMAEREDCGPSRVLEDMLRVAVPAFLATMDDADDPAPSTVRTEGE